MEVEAAVVSDSLCLVLADRLFDYILNAQIHNCAQYGGEDRSPKSAIFRITDIKSSSPEKDCQPN